MEELVQLERRYQEFARRDAKLVVASIETLEVAQRTKGELPHLRVIADHERHLASAAGVIHPESGLDLCDTAAPTTIILDRCGIVRWLHRPSSADVRIAPEKILKAIDEVVHETAHASLFDVNGHLALMHLPRLLLGAVQVTIHVAPAAGPHRDCSDVVRM